ncbi:MAG: Spy/CpxP family protein refolding chaperone [Cellvibrio sp.]|mgnify:CR=1 FL=1|jgi:P pilus assembly/Cpx signaling pathway, periplasmic inhibitor/zinc-resistance associated protein
MNTIKNLRHFITGFTALAVVSLGGHALAQEGGDSGKDCKGKHGFHHHMKKDRSSKHLARFLELTDEQKQALAAHKDEQRADYREQRQQVREAQRELQQAIANNADETEIKVLADRLGDLNTQQIVARAKEKQFLLSILTPEQKEKLEQVKSGHKHHWRGKAERTRA